MASSNIFQIAETENVLLLFKKNQTKLGTFVVKHVLLDTT